MELYILELRVGLPDVCELVNLSMICVKLGMNGKDGYMADARIVNDRG